MEATVEIGGSLATLSGWSWDSNDESLARLLNSMLDQDGPSPSDPQPAINEARRVIGELGGRVVHVKVAEGSPGEVY